MEIIDAHHHLWYYDPVRYAWIDETMKAIRRDFLPEDLTPVLNENGVSGTIVVQADSSPEETDFLLEQAKKTERILGVVGWIDLQSDTLDQYLDRLSGEDKLVGFRHIIQGEPDPIFMLRPDFLRGVEKIFERGYTYDLLVYPHQLVAAVEFVHLFPGCPIVIDHMAKPYITRGFQRGWEVMMHELGSYGHVYCKLSGMITEADWENWTPDDLSPYLDVVTKAFPSGRLMYGSDWPVLNVAGDYRKVLGVIQSHIEPFSLSAQKDILGRTARKFYLDKKI